MRIPAETSIPVRRRLEVTWVGFASARIQLRDSEFCGICEKLALPSAEAARGYIALMLRSADFVARPDDYTFQPYPCPHLAGKWHVGHNYDLIELLKGAAK